MDEPMVNNVRYTLRAMGYKPARDQWVYHNIRCNDIFEIIMSERLRQTIVECYVTGQFIGNNDYASIPDKLLTMLKDDFILLRLRNGTGRVPPPYEDFDVLSENHQRIVREYDILDVIIDPTKINTNRLFQLSLTWNA
jgi:hypothetical protein